MIAGLFPANLTRLLVFHFSYVLGPQSQFRIFINVIASNARPASIRYNVAGAIPISPASSRGPISLTNRHFFMIKPNRM
jgi:hypothetical protein